jgi:hypothetical protein
MTYFKILFHFIGRNMGNNEKIIRLADDLAQTCSKCLLNVKFNVSQLEESHWNHICIFLNKNLAQSQTQCSVFMSSWLIKFQFYENDTNKVLLHHDERCIEEVQLL